MSGPATTFSRAPRAGSRVLALIGGMVGFAVAALLVVLVDGGGGPPARLPGLPDPGPVVTWGLPVLRTLADLSLVAAVGTALLAVLLPLRRDTLSRDARAALRACAVAGGCAAAALAGTALLGFADEVGDLALAMAPATLRADLPHDANAVDLLLSAAVLLGVSATASRAAARGGRDSTVGPLLIAFAGILPIALTGHAASGSRHLLALAALAVHLIAVCTWVGGLGALTGYAVTAGRALAPVVLRFSAVAAACYAAVGLSGVALAATRLSTPGQVVSSDYGRIVIAKTVAYVILGGMALGHRARTLRVLTATEATLGTARRPFVALATAEVLVMAATVGIAVALSRTPPP